MKRCIISFVLSFLFVFAVTAQEGGQISVEKEGLKKVYMHDGSSIDAKQLSSLLKSNPNSLDTYKSSKVFSIAGLSSIAVGTAFIGVGFYYTLKSAQAVGDDDLANTTEYSDKSTNNILIGAGFYVLSVPFMLLSNSNLKKSINLYNASSSSSNIQDVDLYFGVTDSGIGVGLRF